MHRTAPQGVGITTGALRRAGWKRRFSDSTGPSSAPRKGRGLHEAGAKIESRLGGPECGRVLALALLADCFAGLGAW